MVQMEEVVDKWSSAERSRACGMYSLQKYSTVVLSYHSAWPSITPPPSRRRPKRFLATRVVPTLLGVESSLARVFDSE